MFRAMEPDRGKRYFSILSHEAFSSHELEWVSRERAECAPNGTNTLYNFPWPQKTDETRNDTKHILTMRYTMPSQYANTFT
jgi:hypothetical protein